MILARQMHVESIYSDLELNQRALWRTISDPRVYAVLIYKHDRPIGMGAAIHFRHYFSSEWSVKDLWIFVEKNSRGMSGGQAILEFIRAMEAWAAVKGARKIFLESTTGVKTLQTQRIYEKLGYKTTGIVAVKEL